MFISFFYMFGIDHIMHIYSNGIGNTRDIHQGHSHVGEVGGGLDVEVHGMCTESHVQNRNFDVI